MKQEGHNIVKTQYALSPPILYDHNSNDCERIVKAKITQLMAKSLFLCAPEPDENVGYLTYHTQPKCNFLCLWLH